MRNSWLKNLASFVRSPRGTRRFLRHRARPSLSSIRVEHLEDRLAPATVSDGGTASLSIVLGTNENLAIIANHSSYSFSSNQSFTIASDADPANQGTAFSGFNSTHLTLTATGIAQYGTITISDAGSGDTVTFNDSGANSYLNSFAVALTNASAGGVVFNGSSTFAAGLKASAASIDVVGNVNATASINLGAANQITVESGASVTSPGGQIVLQTLAGADGLVEVYGTVDASTASGSGLSGGTVEMFGDYIGVQNGGTVNVSGDTGGGSAFIGGDTLLGGKLPASVGTYVDGTAQIVADAFTSGTGGQVSVIGSDFAIMDGTISACGGATSGDGGSVELSGGIGFEYTGSADLTAANGAIGNVLLDPNNLTISTSTGSNVTITGTNPRTITTTGNSANLNNAVLATDLGTSNIIVQTGTGGANTQIGNLTINATITAPNNSNSLSLRANNNIELNADIDFATNGSSGSLSVEADSVSPDGAGQIVNGGGTVRMGSGALLLSAGSGIGSQTTPIAATGVTNFAAFTATGGIFLSNSGSGNVTITSVTVNSDSATGLTTTAASASENAGTISVQNTATGGSITVSSPISTFANTAGTTGDNRLTAAGSISINSTLTTGNASQADASGNQTPISGSITISAGTSITGSGTLTTGSATLTGADAAGTDSATSGSISLTAGTGGVSGGIGLSAGTALTTGTASRTSATADTVTAGGITLSSRDEIDNGTSSTAMSVAIGSASGGTTNNLGNLVVTTSQSGGNVFITSASNLILRAFSTAAGSTQTVNVATTAGANITVNASSNTNDNWTLNSTGSIAFSGANTLTAASATLSATGAITSGTAATDINTSAANGAITLSGTSIGASGNSMELSPGTGTLSFTTTTGGVFVDLSAGNLLFSNITTLNVEAFNQTIALSTTNGSITIDSTAGTSGYDTPGSNYVLTTNGSGNNIAFSGNTTLIGEVVTLSASGAITSGSASTDINTADDSGTITFSGTSIGGSGNPMELNAGSGGGTLALTASTGGVYVDLSAGNLAPASSTL